MVKRSNEKGVALFFALMLILILSVVGVSLAFVAQSETWSSLNYRMMTQERYGAEAGLESAAYYLANTYTAPGTTGSDVLSSYTTTASPVQYNGHPVVLSTTQSVSNYPVAAVETAFKTAAAGTLSAGNGETLNFSATATLIAMNQVTTVGGPVTVQTWSITADDPISSIRVGDEEVSGVLEREVTFGSVPAPSYGVFATGNACGVLSFSGGITIGSYDSKNATFSGGSLVPDKWGGDIGANGNLNESGGATVNGTYSTPRTGVGNCSSGGVDAWSDSGGATVTGCNSAPPTAPATTCGTTGLVHLPQSVTYAAPVMPNVTAPTTTVSITKNSTCASLGITGCSGSAGNLTLAPGSYGNLDLSGQAQVTLSPAGTFDIQSINVSGNSAIAVANSSAVTLNVITSVNLSGGQTLNLNGSSPVTLNIVGTSSSSPFTSSGGGITNINSNGAPTPGNMIINYAGTHALSLSGGTKTAAAVYAPNAPLNLSGGSNWYGSLIGSNLNDSGGVNIYYDRELGGSSSSTAIATVGNFMMDSFSWSRF